MTPVVLISEQPARMPKIRHGIHSKKTGKRHKHYEYIFAFTSHLLNFIDFKAGYSGKDSGNQQYHQTSPQWIVQLSSPICSAGEYLKIWRG